MAQQIQASIELENGKKITHYRSLFIEQDLFSHHRFEIVVPFEVLEDNPGNFFSQAHKDVCGKSITVSFESLVKKDSYDFRFKGIVTSLSLSNRGDLLNVFIMTGYGATILLEDSETRRTYLNKSLQQIFNSVLSVYPSNLIKKQLRPRNSKPVKYVVQYDETNFRFLSRMASEYGEWFYYDGTQLVLGESPSQKEVPFTIDGVQSFDIAIRLQPGKFKMNGYDYTKDQKYNTGSSSQQIDGLSALGEFAVSESDNLFGQTAYLQTSKTVYSQSDLDDIAKTRKSFYASSLVIFEGQGENPDFSIGSVINASGTQPKKGGRTEEEGFGKYRIIQILHVIDGDGNYSNRFKAIPDTAKYPPFNATLTSPTARPEMATVTDNNDPDKLSRVKVEFNWAGSDKDSDWMRVGTFYSGGEDRKGMQFIPEKNAQVMVGYENNKPESPFVISSFYPKKEGMRSLKGNNEEKAIYTKAGNLVELTDKPGENKILITNVNKPDTCIAIEFKENGIINLSTNGKVEINAQETISLQAQQKISLSAKSIEVNASEQLSCSGSQKVAISGSQITIDAQSAAEIKGGASVKVSSPSSEVSGDSLLTLKGGLVKIN